MDLTEINLEGRSVLVTGGSRGIGLQIARVFGRAGAKVGVVATRDETAQAGAAAVAEVGAEVEAYAADVCDADRAVEVVKAFAERFGGISCLVNNAGITRDNLLMRMREEDWDQVLDVNLKGAFLWTKAVTRPMMKAKSGVIINISSVSGITGNAGQVNYASSKAGMIGMTRSVAQELASRNIRVNAVCPGFIETEMTEQLDEAVREAGRKRIPLGRFGTSEEVANVCLFLASDLASYITGSVIVVDGGMTLA